MFRSLQSKLVAASVAAVVVALLIASAILIAWQRSSQEQERLDHLAAVGPEVSGEVSSYVLSGDPVPVTSIVQAVAQANNVRVLVVNGDGSVVADSSGSLIGQVIDLPVSGGPGPHGVQGAGSDGYITWQPPSGDPGSGLIMISSARPVLPRFVDGVPMPFSGDSLRQGARVVVAVPPSTVTNAWLSLLPGFAIAALIAIPAAVILALLLARSIARPVRQLTAATHQLASGTFDVEVPSGRHDELGELADAFSTMARRVGDSQSEMRTLVANISHDLKTPLTSILGFGRALHTGAVPASDTRRVGGIVEEEANRLATRLNDLLLLSQLDSGTTVVQPARVDLAAITRAVLQRNLSADRYPALQISVDLPVELPVLGDAAKLERSVENLVTNAAKFTPHGGSVDVYGSADGASAQLRIGNTCEPLESEEVARLFDRFYRRDRARSARISGSGLGLGIARDLVAVQGGTLTAQSSGGMLTFTITMPVYAGTAGGSAASPPEEPGTPHLS